MGLVSKKNNPVPPTFIFYYEDLIRIHQHPLIHKQEFMGINDLCTLKLKVESKNVENQSIRGQNQYKIKMK